MTVLVALSFIPVLVMSVLGIRGMPQTLVIALPLVLLLLHLLLEGPHWQCVPLYLLALGLLSSLWVGSSPQRLNITGLRFTGLRFTGLALGTVLLGLSLFLIWLFPTIKLPTPSGSFLVGTTLHLADDVEVRLWYPAASKTTTYTYLDGVNRSLFGLPSFIYSHLKGKPTAAFIDAPVRADKQTFPLIVYVHGADSFAEDNTFRLIELASQGFVVAALGHPKPFGDYGITAQDAHDPEQFSERLATLVVPERVRDVHVATAYLETLNKTDSQFKGKLKLSDFGMLGYSLGGSVVTEYCLEDTRCRAIVNLDGSGFGEARAVGVNAAYLQLSQSAALPLEPLTNPQTVAERTSTHYLAEVGDVLQKTQAFQDVYWFRLRGSGHASFTDLAHWTPVRLSPLKTVMGEGNADTLSRVISDLTVAFFKERLEQEVVFNEVIKSHDDYLAKLLW